MKKRNCMDVKFGWLCLLVLFLSLSLPAQEAGNSPLTVSPGSETGVVTVSQRCPTFSWSSVAHAFSYRVAVFQAEDTRILSYEDMNAMFAPAISTDIAGPALSWTPSVEENLQSGNIYIWYVQAVDGDGQPQGPWSNGRLFKIEQEIACAGLAGTRGEILKSHGIEDLQQEVKEVQGVAGITTPTRGGTLGYEGATNTFYGATAGTVTTGYYNSFFGAFSGYSNTTGQGNNFLGYYAGSQNTSGEYNTFVGNRAGYSNTTASNNIFIGTRSGFSTTTGNDNNFIGNYAGYSNTTGFNNNFMGYYAGHENITGRYNNFIGFQSGPVNTSGYNNNFIGSQSGYRNTTGYGNNFLGESAGYNNTTGYWNVFLGDSAGYGNITGDYNVYLGYRAGYNETGSHKLYIADSNTSSPLLYGEFDNSILTVNGKLGINTKTPGYTIEANETGANACMVIKRTDGATNYINATDTYANFGSTTNHPLRLVVNSVARMTLNTDHSVTMSNGATLTAGGVWTNASSRVLKENIQTLDTASAMATLAGLTPVTYNYKSDKSDSYVGFIAEDVPELVATADRKGLSPMDVTAVLTKVLQEQQRINQELQGVVHQQQKLICDLQNRMAQLEKK